MNPRETRGHEEWLKIEGWPLYEVSNAGGVRRALDAPSYRNTTHPGRLLKPYVDEDGYERVRLCGPDGARQTFQVHRLVAIAFVSGRADGLVVAHRDGTTANNNSDNLCWVTQAENIQHREAHGTTARGERIHCAKLTAENVRFMLSDFVGRRGQKTAYARKFGVSNTAIGAVLSGKVWSHVNGD